MGIAHDRYNIVMVQHFSSDYVRYEKPPLIDSSGTLSLKGKVEGRDHGDRQCVEHNNRL